MKVILSILLILISTACFATVYTVTPQMGIGQNGNPNGYVVINCDQAGHPGAGNVNLNIVGGDIIELDENGATFYWVQVIYGTGSPTNYFIIHNKPGQVTHVGNPNYPAGGFAYGQDLRVDACKYWILEGTTTDKNSLIINGSTDNTWRGSTLNLQIDTYSEYFELRYFTVKDGGTGVWAKKEVDYNNPLSWASSGRLLHHFYIHDLLVDNAWNESFYIGHTAEHWNITTNLPQGAPYYAANPSDLTGANDTTTYKVPIDIDTLWIFNVTVKNGGADAYQLSHCRYVEAAGLRLISWATRGPGSDVGGILIGGGTRSSYIHDCYLTAPIHSAGEAVQFYGTGGGTHVFRNNLILGSDSSETFSYAPRAGVAFGTVKAATLTITHNTIYFGKHNVRLNSFFDSVPTSVICDSNLFIGPTQGVYIYLENGGAATETFSKKFLSAAAANVNTDAYYYPFAGSTIGAAGYRKKKKGYY